MKLLGKYSHTTPQGLAVVKLTTVPVVGKGVADVKGQRIGEIADVFGPISAPYATVRLVGKVEPPLNARTELYMIEGKTGRGRR